MKNPKTLNLQDSIQSISYSIALFLVFHIQHSQGQEMTRYYEFKEWTSNTAFMGWVNGNKELINPKEWNSLLKPRIKSANNKATIHIINSQLNEITYMGRDRLKKGYYQLPADSTQIKGLVLFLHGTGGSSDFIKKTNSLYFKNRFLANGYVVASTEAEESTLGKDIDCQGNVKGKLRWCVSDISNPRNNVDFFNIQKFINYLRQEISHLDENSPVISVGMSNGGVFSVALGAIGLVDVAVSYCAGGNDEAISSTQVPTHWFLCANDQISDNNDTILKQNELKRRGIPTYLEIRNQRPLTYTQLDRIEGITTQTSISLFDEFKKNGLLDNNNYILYPIELTRQIIESQPRKFPIYMSFSNPEKGEIDNVLKVARAEHAFYDDLSGRTIDLINGSLNMVNK